MSSSRKSKSGLRTSSGHSMVLSTSTPSRTRSVASCSRWRSATLTIATRSESVERVAQQHVRLGRPCPPAPGSRPCCRGSGRPARPARTPARRSPGGGQRQVGEVLVGEDDHLAAAEVVALGDVVVGDLFAADRAGALVPDPAAVVAVHLVEPDVLLLGGRVQLHRDRHQPERDRALPDRPHRPLPSRRVRSPPGSHSCKTATRAATARSMRSRVGRAGRAAQADARHDRASCRPGAGWAYEFKWDGVRAIADVAGGARRAVRALRRGDHRRLPGAGRPRPRAGRHDARARRRGRRARRARAARRSRRSPSGCTCATQARAARLAGSLPVTYMIFDLLRLGRRRPDRLPVRASAGTPLEALGLGGAALGGAADLRRRPGHAGRRRRSTAWRAWSPSGSTSIYRPGLRSPDWVKVKLECTGDFVVGGWRPGAREIGALLVGVPGPDGRLALPRPGRRRDLAPPPSGSCSPCWSRCAAGASPFARGGARARMRAARSGYDPRSWWR